MIQLIPTMRVAMMRDRRPASATFMKEVVKPPKEPAVAPEKDQTDRGNHWLKMSALAAIGLVLLGWWVSRVPAKFEATATFDRIVDKIGETKSETLSASDMTNDLLRREIVQAVAWELGRAGTEEELNAFQNELRKQLHAKVEQTSNEVHRVIVQVKHRDPNVARRTADAVVARYFEAEHGRDERAQLKSQIADAISRLEEARDREAFENAQLQKVEQSRTAEDAPSLRKLQKQLLLAIDEATAQRETLKKSYSQETADLPATPGLVHVARKENDTLAHQALRRLLKDREDLADSLSEQHPAVVSLDRRIRDLARDCGIDNPRSLLKARAEVDGSGNSEVAAELKIKLARSAKHIEELKRDEQRVTFSLNHLEKLSVDLKNQSNRVMAAQIAREKIERECVQMQTKLASLGGTVGLQRVATIGEADSVERVGPNRLFNFVAAAACWLGLMGLVSFWTGSRKRARVD